MERCSWDAAVKLGWFGRSRAWCAMPDYVYSVVCLISQHEGGMCLHIFI